MAWWTRHKVCTRSGSTDTSAPRRCRRSQRWCRGGKTHKPCSQDFWTRLSALYGVLAEIEALGLDLVEVRRLDEGGSEPGG